MKSLPLEPVYCLLVDDLEENLLALEAVLRRDDLVLLRATSGPQALELLLQHDVALALIDVRMPGMDGFELAELMRGVERTRLVPIIFLTAGGTDWERRFRGYEAGAVDFLHKPIQPDILRSKADVFFQLYRQRREVAAQRDQLKAATEEISRLLAESRQQAAALKEADRRKDEFLAMLAHELRNPLAPIRNAVEILDLVSMSPDAVAQAREIISRQITHMVHLVDDLLDVVRIARGKIQLRVQRCDISRIVSQTIEDYRPTMEAAGIGMKAEIAAGPLVIDADPVRIAQVVGNLLHNSTKFTPAGGEVHVCVHRDDGPQAAVISIRDTGAGLQPRELAHIFEPFVQAEPSIDRNPGGLGLGLALVRGLVELHGGRVAAASDGPGRGATFSLTLPLGTQESSSQGHTSPDPGNLRAESRPLRILLIEDNHDAAHTLRLLLESFGHQVHLAANGEQGIDCAHRVRPDVVISDLGLPGEVDGYGVAETLRRDPQLRSTQMIALSGYGQPEDKQRAASAGFDAHLIKPVRFAELDEVLRTPVTRCDSAATSV